MAKAKKTVKPETESIQSGLVESPKEVIKEVFNLVKFKKEFNQYVKQDIFYSTSKFGALQLRRTHIPKEVCENCFTFLDSDTYLKMAAEALQLRLSTDEFIRRLLWFYFEKS